MNKSESDKVKALIHRIGLKYNLSDDIIRNIVNSPYKFTKETITNLELNNLTEEEFNELKVNFIYKYLGKLYTTFPIINKHIKQSETQINNLNKRWKK